MTVIDTEYQARVSIRYHRKREQFYRVMDNLGKGVSLLAIVSLGTSAVANWIGLVIGGLSATVTIISIVLDFSSAAAKHAVLAQRFLTLLSSIQRKKVTEEEAIRRLHSIAKDEPPCLRGLAQLCQDEQDAADGRPVDVKCFSLRRRIEAQFGRGELPIDYDHSGSASRP